MKRRKLAGIAALALILIMLVACAPDGNGDTMPAESGAAKVVEDYLQARVEGNADTLRSLSCAEWEGQAAIQAQSFRSMNAVLEGVACQPGGADGDYTLVTCEGKIVTSYNGETRDWPLGTYRAIEEGGEWRMCGEG